MSGENPICDGRGVSSANYVDAFFKATGLDLALIEEESKGGFLRSLHTPYCRKVSRKGAGSGECYRFFQSLCESARRAGQGKMITKLCPFGRQCGAVLLDSSAERKSYLVFGRALVSPDASGEREINVSAGCYESAMQIINLSMPVLKRELRKASQVPSNELSGGVVHARSFIESDFQNGIHCRDIAAAVGLGEDHLSRLFRKELGVSLSVYLSRVRLNYAEDLLRETEKNITEICFESGYGSLSQFNRAFRARFKVSPRVFRKAVQVLPSGEET